MTRSGALEPSERQGSVAAGGEAVTEKAKVKSIPVPDSAEDTISISLCLEHFFCGIICKGKNLGSPQAQLSRSHSTV